MTWIPLTIIGMLAIGIAQIPMRIHGLTLFTYLWYTIIVVSLTGWILPIAISRAPSLTAYWFLAIGLLSVFGVVLGYFLHDPFEYKHLIGIALILVGSYFLT